MTDVFAWSQAQAAAIRARRWETVDVEAVAEEIEDLGIKVRHEIKNQMIRLLEHMLKMQYVATPANLRGWEASVSDARAELADAVEENPSLAGYPADVLALAYKRASVRVSGYCGVAVPDVCPWTINQVLGR